MGMYRREDAQKVVDVCLNRGGNLSYVISPEYQDEDGFNIHQIRCSYYSVLDCDDTAYLAARAIQFFVPGIPQVYYVGMLAGENDLESVKRTGEGREINRHNFTLEEIEQSVKKEVVQKLIDLIRLRNTHPAFNGAFTAGSCGDQDLVLSWAKNEDFTELVVRLEPFSAIVTFNEPGTQAIKTLHL